MMARWQGRERSSSANGWAGCSVTTAGQPESSGIPGLQRIGGEVCQETATGGDACN